MDAVKRLKAWTNVAALASGGASLSSFAASIQAGWEYENSGNLGLDSSAAGLNLTNNNSATQTTGKVGSGAVAIASASAQYLSRADEAAFRIVGGIWIASWVYVTATGASRTWCGKGTASNYEYSAAYNDTSNRFTFTIYTAAGSGAGTATANTFGAVSAATWYHVVCYYDATASGTVGISVNGGAFDTAAKSGAIANGTSAIALGRMPDGSAFWNGRLDATLFGRGYVPTLADSVFLYNAGAGRTYAEALAH